MSIEIVREDGLSRQRWVFSPFIRFGNDGIYFDYYIVEAKESPLHKKWIRQSYWSRLMQRENTLKEPPLPADVDRELYDRLSKYIFSLKIIQ
jgi:hypothetical protein